MTGENETKQTILAVDDTPENLDVVKSILVPEYTVKAAVNGKMALKIAESQAPDLILLDIMMPEMDGYEVCRQLKANPATQKIPVIFLTAKDEIEDETKGLEIGAVDYILKPVSPPILEARVKTHLTLMENMKQLERSYDVVAAAHARMKKDLDAAARVQQSLLPASLPESDRLHIAWQYHPCDELAGDSLNVHRLGPGHILFYVVDVSGHGVPAALLSVSVARSLEPSEDPSSLVTDSSGGATSPAEVAERLNSLYPRENHGDHYFTMVYGVLNVETGQFRFITAGHAGPILVRPGEPPRQVAAPSLMIGALRDVTFSDSEIELEAGDRLYLFSDGLYEETNDEDEQFEISRLMDALASRVAGPLDASLEGVRQDLIGWHGSENFTDDFSVLAVEYLEKS